MLGSREKRLRAVFRSGVVIGGALLAAVACNKAEFTDTRTGGCKDVMCTCEEDPLQPTCKGFNGRPDYEGGFDAASVPEEDGSTIPEAGVDSSAADADDDGG